MIWIYILSFQLVYLWDSINGPRRQYMVSQRSTITFGYTRHNTVIVTLKDKQESVKAANHLLVLCMNTVNVLTISWHHTHRFPAKVLIFLKQTWHLVALQSALIQSWAGFWSTQQMEKQLLSIAATYSFVFLLFIQCRQLHRQVCLKSDSYYFPLIIRHICSLAWWIKTTLPEEEQENYISFSKIKRITLIQSRYGGHQYLQIYSQIYYKRRLVSPSFPTAKQTGAASAVISYRFLKQWVVTITALKKEIRVIAVYAWAELEHLTDVQSRPYQL